jgi:hypothetical protein
MIDTLGSNNLFANKFIIGTNSVIKEYTKTSTEEIEYFNLILSVAFLFLIRRESTLPREMD